MNSITIVIISAVLLTLAYRFYGTFLANRVFKVDHASKVPSVHLRDDIDYVPTKKEVLFGHHFASIAGTGPIVGPAIAVIWGWVPALIWIIVGSVVAGAVHDYASLLISVRNHGVSIGDISKGFIGNRAHTLFLFVILFALWIVVAIFGMVIAAIFKLYPQAVIPVWTQIPIAVAVGFLAYKKKMNILVLSIIAVVLMYASIFIGVHFPFIMPALFGINPMVVWILILLVYAYIASILPVWTLLQPRDYINSHQLIIGIGLLVFGVFFANPKIVAPAIQLAPQGAPPILPFLFITVACGAVSGFHSLVSSGTTSKQLASETDAKFIGYGGMLLEAFLAVLVLIAVAAGIGMKATSPSGTILTGQAAWNSFYSSWEAMQGLTAKVGAFVSGSANMLETFGIPFKYGCAIIGVLVASFAGTTLDTATRIQRYIVNEVGAKYRIKALRGRYRATFIVIVAAMLLAFCEKDGKGALVLWPLFGTSNQLLAALSLLVAFTYLIKKKLKSWPVLIPLIFMVGISGWAMVVSLGHYIDTARWHLVAIECVLIGLQVWMVVEAIKNLKFKISKTG